jgi:hypothetical protein
MRIRRENKFSLSPNKIPKKIGVYNKRQNTSRASTRKPLAVSRVVAVAVPWNLEPVACIPNVTQADSGGRSNYYRYRGW